MSLGECSRVVVKSVCSVFLRLAPTIQCILTSVDVRVLSHLKEELAWAVNKRLRVISTIM